MDRLNESQLRRQVERKGYPISGRQFRDFQQWGLIPPPDTEGRWSDDTVGILIQIRALGETIRSLPRRVILLRGEGLPIPGDRIQEAMREIVPTIGKPVSTMRRVARARRLLAEPAAARLTDREWRTWDQEAGKIPEPSQWPDIISQAIPDGIDRHFPDRWYLSALWMRERTRNTPYDVTDIALEEMLTMLAVLNIAAAREEMEREQSNAEHA